MEEGKAEILNPTPSLAPSLETPTGQKEARPLTQIELRNRGIVIKYPGNPINLYLGPDKLLQIINVQGNPQFNADYLLIDPTTFDPRNPTTGYKGIRLNEPIVVGRLSPWRFDLPNTVSRIHLRISLLKNGTLAISDMNSTNGTVVRFKDPQQLSAEQIKAQELGPEIKRVLAEFFQYVQTHQSKIKTALQQGQDLANLFYQDFYSHNIDNPKYRENDPAVQQLAKKYAAQVNAARENLLREAQRGRGPTPLDNGYWLYVNTNGGYRKQSALGRFYFNLKPEYVVPMFLNIAMAFHNAGLRSQIKIPMVGNAETFDRLDKMVVYFNAEELHRVLEIIENLHRNNPGAFADTGIPRFTAEVKDKSGRKMAGIGFGEEPLLENHSFGEVRAKILAEVYLKIMGNCPRRSIYYDPNLVEMAFHGACLKYKIDPRNPAFNLGGLEKFPELRMRISA